MAEISNSEELMIFLINVFGQKFPQSAILKGGMSLRLLDCPRYTNDLDYVFVPFKSKNDIAGDICKELDAIDGLEYTYEMNSKCMRIRVKYNNVSTQIEVNVAKECPSVPVSTEPLASQTGQLSTIIRIVDYRIAMANKLAAWNERLLVRDLYDLNYYYTFLDKLPDKDTLMKRLRKIGSTKRNKNPKTMTLEQLIERLRDALKKLTADDLNEIAGVVPADHLPGLEVRIKANLLKFCEELEDKWL